MSDQNKNGKRVAKLVQQPRAGLRLGGNNYDFILASFMWSSGDKRGGGAVDRSDGGINYVFCNRIPPN